MVWGKISAGNLAGLGQAGSAANRESWAGSVH